MQLHAIFVHLRCTTGLLLIVSWLVSMSVYTGCCVPTAVQCVVAPHYVGLTFKAVCATSMSGPLKKRHLLTNVRVRHRSDVQLDLLTNDWLPPVTCLYMPTAMGGSCLHVRLNAHLLCVWHHVTQQWPQWRTFCYWLCEQLLPVSVTEESWLLDSCC